MEGVELLAESRRKDKEVDEDMPTALPARSIVLAKPKEKKRKRDGKLERLIKRSKKRSAMDCEDEGTKLTSKEQVEQKVSRDLLDTLRSSIEEQNRNKESIVFGHLKKILYGERRGKHIKDTTFRTILKGECSASYMSVVKEQEMLLDKFNGNERSRKQLVHRFAGILGQMSRQDLAGSRELLEG